MKRVDRIALEPVRTYGRVRTGVRVTVLTAGPGPVWGLGSGVWLGLLVW